MPAKTPPFSHSREAFLTAPEKPSTNANKMGFSLVEILIALTLFGFLVSGMITFVTGGLEVTQKTGKRLTEQQNGNPLEKRLQFALANPVTRIDTGTATSATGVILDIDGRSVFIGAQSMTGMCATNPTQEFLLVHEADGQSTGEIRSAGAFSIASDGLSIYSGTTRIIGSGVRGGNASTDPLQTELGGASSLAFSGTTLAIADPHNEQVLLWDTASGSLSTVTTRSSGIVGPTSLRFTNSGLLIGSGNGLYVMADGNGDGSELFPVPVSGPRSSLTTIASVQVTLDEATALTGPVAAESISIEKDVSGVWQPLYESGDSVALSANGFAYTFTGSARAIGAGEPIRIGVRDIAPLPTTSGQYTANVELFDGIGTPLWSTRIPYFILGDGNLGTLGSNSITRLANDTYVRAVTDATTYQQGNLSIDDYLQVTGNQNSSILPIRNFNILETADHIILSYEAYSEYDCREANHKSKAQLLVFRKK